MCDDRYFAETKESPTTGMNPADELSGARVRRSTNRAVRHDSIDGAVPVRRFPERDGLVVHLGLGLDLDAGYAIASAVHRSSWLAVCEWQSLIVR